MFVMESHVAACHVFITATVMQEWCRQLDYSDVGFHGALCQCIPITASHAVCSDFSHPAQCSNHISQGLTKSFNLGTVVCSPITAELIITKLKVRYSQLLPHCVQRQAG